MKFKSTPWGPAQDIEFVADGIHFISTASHGGYHLSPERAAQMPTYFRDTFVGSPRWYEEDCDWARVALAFPKAFPPNAQERARQTLAYFHIDKLAAFDADVASGRMPID